MQAVKTDSSHRLCITVCTRDRPLMLSRLIKSYQNLQIPAGLWVMLIVVENDPSPKMRGLVESLGRDSERPIFYASEPRLGIPIARNRCIDEAQGQQATHIAFVDDDEWLSEEWLKHLWAYYVTQDPLSAIQGPVLAQLPAHVPSYFYEIFEREAHPTGTRLRTCLTGNVLLSLDFFEIFDVRFDETYALTGGEDSHLFHQAYEKGATLLFCAEAIVYEEVPHQRLTFGWLSMRYFRVGLTMGQRKQFSSKIQLSKHVARRSLRALKYLLQAMSYRVVWNKGKCWHFWLKACRSLGVALGPTGVKINPYSRIEGH